MNDTALTRRALLRGAAALTAVAILPLPALAAERAVTGDAAAAAEPAVRATVDLDALSEAEQETATKFCWLAAALMTDDELAAVLGSAYDATELDPNLDFDGLMAAIGGEERMLVLRGRRFTGSLPLELTDERKAAGVLVGLGFVRALHVETFAKAHAMAMEIAA
jgi:hypothetical protein